MLFLGLPAGRSYLPTEDIEGGGVETQRDVVDTRGGDTRSDAGVGDRDQVQVQVHPLLRRTDDLGNTPLHHASAYGHLKTCRILVEAGADAGCRNGSSWNAVDVSRSVAAEVYLRGLVRERGERVGYKGEDEGHMLVGRESRPRLHSDEAAWPERESSRVGGLRLVVREDEDEEERSVQWEVESGDVSA